MREILFRGKRVDDGKWLYGDLIQAVDKSEVAIIEEKDCFVCNAETVGQYTGLTDKSGKKIFEGDIVAFKGIRDENGKLFADWISPVGYRTTGFVVYPNGKPFPLYWYTDHDYEVLGNVFDNPDLIKENE